MAILAIKMTQNIEELKDRTILGLIEFVEIKTKTAPYLTLKARIDTGAQKSSIDDVLAKKLDLGPILKEKVIKQSTGKTIRPVIKAKILLKGKEISGLFTLADRSNMKYQILIGQNILKKGKFLVDPLKTIEKNNEA